MNEWPTIDAFLQTDPRDVGCERAVEMLHIYVDLVVGDPLSAAARHPEISAHLRACGPCAQDFDGLLAAVIKQPPPV